MTGTVLALCAGLTLAGCSTAGTPAKADSDGGGDRPRLSVAGAFMPRPVGDDMAAGFLTVRNDGGTADRLTSVTSTLADEVTMHTAKDQRMHEVDSFAVPAEGELSLRRGGDHLMFMGLGKRPAEGDTVTVELRFEKSEPVTVDLPVKSASYNPATTTGGDSSGPGEGAGSGAATHPPSHSAGH
ncbi:copper chaperone PCu(A)C [Streptomyces sp. NPDC000594]|uniref:copper chaperone PCu(A)C n=1 Tax=Streptomyces sp. NPDC000594 TaxID=3154261 RepID=UPI003323E0DE